MKTLTIAWDIDDVLNDLMLTWFKKKWAREHKECNFCFEQINENPPNRILNCQLSTYLKSLDEFRFSREYERMKPNKEILRWFKSYGFKARHLALTAVPEKAAHISAGWLLKNFGRWFRSFNFVPSVRRGYPLKYSTFRSKADCLKWLKNVDILIDDNPNNIKEAQGLGIKGILIAAPWNSAGMPREKALIELNNILR